MFDSVLRPQQTSATRWSTSAFIAVFIHVAALYVAWRVARPSEKAAKSNVQVTFVKAAAPPPPPPPPPPKKTTTHKTEIHKIPKPDVIVQPKEIPQEKPQEKPAAKEEAEDDGVEGGVEGGVKGGVVGGVLGGVVGGVLGGTGTAKRVAYDDGKVTLKKLVSREVVYPEQAIEKEIQGLVSVKCIIGVDGQVRDCHIMKDLPFLGRAAVDALQHTRYAPPMVDGQPVEVEIVFNLHMVLPEG